MLTAWFFLYHHDHGAERLPERLAALSNWSERRRRRAAGPARRSSKGLSALRLHRRTLPAMALKPDPGKDIAGFAEPLRACVIAPAQSRDHVRGISWGGARFVAVTLPYSHPLMRGPALPSLPLRIPSSSCSRPIPISATLLCLRAARESTRPLRRLALAARENFDAQRLTSRRPPNAGRMKNRIAACVLNQMRERNQKHDRRADANCWAVCQRLFVQARSRGSACDAKFHDVSATCMRMLEDLCRMNAMLENVPHSSPRRRQRRWQAMIIDLVTSLQTICSSVC